MVRETGSWNCFMKAISDLIRWISKLRVGIHNICANLLALDRQASGVISTKTRDFDWGRPYHSSSFKPSFHAFSLSPISSPPLPLLSRGRRTHLPNIRRSSQFSYLIGSVLASFMALSISKATPHLSLIGMCSTTFALKENSSAIVGSWKLPKARKFGCWVDVWVSIPRVLQFLCIACLDETGNPHPWQREIWLWSNQAWGILSVSDMCFQMCTHAIQPCEPSIDSFMGLAVVERTWKFHLWTRLDIVGWEWWGLTCG